MLIENIKKVEQIWKTENLELAETLSSNDIAGAFANLDVFVSRDVVEVYSNLGGMADNVADSVLFSFWTVEKILTENELKSEIIFFADFLIYSHLYGFKFENDDTSSIHIWWDRNQTEKIADSFEEFFENYLTKPEKYFLFGRED